MRVLFIAPFGTCQKQTVSRRMLPLAQRLAGRGHEVEMLIPAWDCPQEAGQVQQAGDVTLRWPQVGPRLHALSDPLLLWRMIRAASRFQPALVHAFKTFGYSGATAQWLGRRGRAAIVVDLDDLETVQGWGGRRPLLMRLLGGAQETQTLRRADGVTAASISLRVRAEHLRGFQEDVLYLPNGLERAPSPAPVAENEAVVLLYTRGNDVNVERLVALWQRVRERAPGARLRIVGDWADAPALPGSEHLGWLDEEALEQALRSSALALFPTPDSPSLRAKSPARLLDCLAQGLPVITTEVGEYGVLSGEGGYVAETDDDASMARAIIRLLGRPELRAEMGRAAWEAAGRHTWEARAESLCALYRSLGLDV